MLICRARSSSAAAARFAKPSKACASCDSRASVWLRADLGLLWDRERDRPGRPLLQVADPRAVLSDLLDRRYPIYAEADVVVDSRRGAGPEVIAREVARAVQDWDASRPDRMATLEAMP